MYPYELIARYFSGEATPEEVQTLDEWVQSDPAHAAAFDAYRLAWQEVARVQVNENLDTDSGWQSVKVKMQELADEPAEREPARRIRPYARYFSIAAGLLVLLSSAFLLYRIVAKPGNIHVKAGETSIVQVLPDGSKVTLAKGAEIDYPERFTTTGRNITLKGKAYFEVTHDASRPFRVSCNAAIIEVLGTSFNVVTGTGQTEVDLTSGKVSVYLASKPESGVLLASGEKAIVSPGDNQIKKSSSKDLNYMAWKTGDLIFTDATLRYIVKTLNDYYGSSIQLSCPELAGCRLTASFSNQSEDAVIRVIAASLNLSAVKRQGVTILEGEGCR